MATVIRYFFIVILITSCNSGYLDKGSTKLNQNNKYLNELNFFETPIIKDNKNILFTCSNTFCITALSQPQALYTIANMQHVWVKKHILFSIQVTFNSETLNFKLKKFYQDTTNGVSGRISEVYTPINQSPCLNGKDYHKGDSCNLVFSYEGTSPKTIKNILNILISNDSNPDFLFQIPLQNSMSTIENIADLQAQSMTQENNEEISLIAVTPNIINDIPQYNTNVSTDWYNIGDGIIDEPFDEDISDDRVAFSLGVSNPSFNANGIIFPLQTHQIDCKNNTLIASGDKCSLNNGQLQIPDNSIFGKFVLEYTTKNNYINIVEPYLISVGDFMPRNYNLTSISEDQQKSKFKIQISLPKLSNRLKNNRNISDISFEVKQNLQIHIPYRISIKDNSIEYNLNNEAETLENLSYNIIDNDCLSSKISESPNCEIEINSKYPIVAPIGGYLIVSYYSSIKQAKVSQILGLITFNPNT